MFRAGANTTIGTTLAKENKPAPPEEADDCSLGYE